jgi:hypothetical protein
MFVLQLSFKKNELICRVKLKRMIEVFKTNINCADKATQLVEQIHENFASYRANFDLNDCDRILRVVSGNNNIDPL